MGLDKPLNEEIVKYIRVKGISGTYLFTENELDRALDRENQGVIGDIEEEQDYGEMLN